MPEAQEGVWVLVPRDLPDPDEPLPWSEWLELAAYHGARMEHPIATPAHVAALTERVRVLEERLASAIERGNGWREKYAEDTPLIHRLEGALRSIASNTCCDTCREAALVARAALTPAEGQEDA